MTDPLYILRYSLPPEPTDAQPQRLEELRRICQTARIDEVMLFIMPEEYNNGQWDPADYLPWIDSAVQAKTMLESMNIAVSLNPWITILHASRGRHSEHLNYRRLVSDTGETSSAVACHLCPQWQEIFHNAFGDFARAGFKTIWVEDDFRFHNHDQGWGGCFCDHHIQRLRDMGAAATNRQELIQNLNAPNTVHPDRLLWMQLNRQTYVDMARALRQHIDTIAPDVQLGLMCSLMPTHSLEGRDWPELIDALGGPDRTPVRPHGSTYQEAICNGLIQPAANISATLSVLPPQTKTFFEIENCPMSRYAKSNQLTAANMAQSLHAGCHGQSLDVYDFLGSGHASEPDMASTLAQNRPALQAIRSAAQATTPSGIICLLHHATTARTPGTGIPDIHALPQYDYGIYSYLQMYGWPAVNQVIDDTFTPQPAAVYALSGNSAWALTTTALDALIRQSTLILDGTAAHILCLRGYAQDLAITDYRRITHHDAPFSIEQALHRTQGQIPQRTGVNIVPMNWPLFVTQLNDTAQPITEILDATLQSIGIGSFRYQHPQGGKGLVLPYHLPLPATLADWTKKHLLNAALTDLGIHQKFPYLPDTPWCYIDYRQNQNTASLFLLNASLEVLPQLKLNLPPQLTAAKPSLVARSRQLPAQLTANSNTLTITTTLAAADWLNITFSS